MREYKASLTKFIGHYSVANCNTLKENFVTHSHMHSSKHTQKIAFVISSHGLKQIKSEIVKAIQFSEILVNAMFQPAVVIHLLDMSGIE